MTRRRGKGNAGRGRANDGARAGKSERLQGIAPAELPLHFDALKGW
jgi:hypothetical protein